MAAAPEQNSRSGELGNKDSCAGYRQELELLAVYYSEDSNSTSFFPRERLQDFFKIEMVADILECTCRSCTTDMKLDLFDRVILTETRTSNYSSMILSEYVSTFALLLHIQHPQLIRSFPSQEYKDNQLERWMGKRHEVFLDELWPEYRIKAKDRSMVAARNFLKELPRFCVPTLDTSAYVQWKEGRLLPFVKEVDISSPSGNSKVVKFEIWDSYRKFPGLNITKFARKEINIGQEPQDLIRASHEKMALQLVRRLKDDHIVRMVKTYSLGKTFNIMFPCARTSLHEYLRDQKFNAQEACDRYIWKASFWNQFIGIALALSRVHKLGEELQNKSTDRPTDGNLTVLRNRVHPYLIGCHFDLKPANILVQQDGTWVITDFGQTSFKALDNNGMSSNIVFAGGTPIYSPPLETNGTTNRSYDVWSLGCILLEVVAFLVLKYEGLEGLDKARVTPSLDPHVTEDRSFYARDLGTGEFIVKPTVSQFIKDLPAKLRRAEDKGHPFLAKILRLVRKMLNPNSATRPQARAVYEELRRIVNETQGPGDGLPHEWASKEPDSEDNAKLRDIAKNGASAKIKSAAKKGKAVAGSMPFLKKHINTEPSDETDLSNKKGSASVQLWAEQKCWFSVDRYATSKARAEREVPPRRVVIYGVGRHGKSIAILRFHQNFKLEEDESAQLVRFIPTNKARDVRFSMVIFEPPPDKDGQEFFAGIPIDSQLLRKYEDENSIDCKAVSMKFKNSEERTEFADDYLWMREDWRKERHGEA
ncbi:hypothetical protein SLS56_002833 [Neofusicoccum ribis]|uniref:non-specific serine/threonine protein kinase n=1 Tax=Neofusicoccum ribis TaxID=45134 RepID=A0ABR3T292_9PEZI